MKVYIAGKVTGLPKDEIFKKFYESGKTLKERGHIPMSPAVLALNEGFEHGDYMHICFAMIDVCDAVYMQKDWQKSKGARMELQYAKDWRKQIIYEDELTREDVMSEGKITIRNTVDSPEEREALNPDCAERDRENGIGTEKDESGNGGE